MKIKFSIKKLALLCIVIFVVLLIFLKQYNDRVAQVFKDSKYTLATLSDAVEYSASQSYVFSSHDKDMIIGTKDGLKRVATNGKIIYDQPFTMSNPYIVHRGKYLVAMDLGGHSIYVFNNSELLYSKETTYPILMGNISKGGTLAIVEENKDAHTVSVLNKNGDALFKWHTSVDKGGYPIDLALSNDSNQLVVSYVDISGIAPEAKLIFFDLSSSGIYNSDKIVGSVHEDNAIISRICLIDNSYYVAFSNNYIKGYRYGNTIEEVFTIEITNKVIDVAYEYNGGYFAVAYGDPIPGVDKTQDGQIVLYDKYGNEISKFASKGHVSYLDVYNDEIIIGENRNFVSVRRGGYVNWSYTTTVDVKGLIPITNNKVLFVGENYYQVLEKVKAY